MTVWGLWQSEQTAFAAWWLFKYSSTASSWHIPQLSPGDLSPLSAWGLWQSMHSAFPAWRPFDNSSIVSSWHMSQLSFSGTTPSSGWSSVTEWQDPQPSSACFVPANWVPSTYRRSSPSSKLDESPWHSRQSSVSMALDELMPMPATNIMKPKIQIIRNFALSTILPLFLTYRT